MCTSHDIRKMYKRCIALDLAQQQAKKQKLLHDLSCVYTYLRNDVSRSRVKGKAVALAHVSVGLAAIGT